MKPREKTPALVALPSPLPSDAVAIDISAYPTRPVRSCSSPIAATSSAARRKHAIPVCTEFVFSGNVRYKSVMLCGDWCDWQPIPMQPEQDYIWSTITIVPTGYREFCYIVDGQYMVSRKHPTNPEGTRNWRKVYGPPLRKRMSDPRAALSGFFERISFACRAFFSAFKASPKLDLDDADSFVSLAQSRRVKRSCFRRTMWIQLLVFALAVYAVSLVIVYGRRTRAK